MGRLIAHRQPGKFDSILFHFLIKLWVWANRFLWGMLFRDFSSKCQRFLWPACPCVWDIKLMLRLGIESLVFSVGHGWIFCKYFDSRRKINRHSRRHIFHPIPKNTLRQSGKFWFNFVPILIHWYDITVTHIVCGKINCTKEYGIFD